MCSLKSLLAKDPTPKLTAWPGKLPYIPLSAIEPKEESVVYRLDPNLPTPAIMRATVGISGC